MEQIRKTLEQALNIEMVPHDSLYWGEYYLWESPVSNVIQLVYNLDPLDGEPFERDHANFGTLIYATLDQPTYDQFHRILSTLSSLQLISQE